MLARARACRLVLSISHRSLHAPRLPQPVPAWAGALAARAMAERLVAKTAPQDMAAASALQHVYTILNSRCEDARSLQDASLREGADGDTSAASGSQGDKEGGEAEGEADEVEGLVAELCLSLVEANGDELATVPLSAVAATLEEVLLELGVAQELPDGQLRLGSNNDARRARTMLLDMADEEEEGEDEEADEDDEAEEGAGTEGNGDGTRDDVGVEDDGDYDEVDEYDGEGGGEDAELEQADDEPEDMALLRSLLEPAPPTGTDEETAVAAKAEARAARVAAKESAGPGANLREVSFDLGRLEHESGRRRTDWQESVRHQRLSARIAEALRVMVYLDNISDDLVQGAVQLVDVRARRVRGARGGESSFIEAKTVTGSQVWVDVIAFD